MLNFICKNLKNEGKHFIKNKKSQSRKFSRGKTSLLSFLNPFSCQSVLLPALTITPRDQPFKANELLRFYTKSSEGGEENARLTVQEREKEK